MTPLDDVLPRFDCSERHRIKISAPPCRIMTAAGVWRAADDPLIRAAIRLREIPARLLGRGRRRSLERDDFTVLEPRGDMALVYGLIGAFGRADDGLCAIPSTEAFLSRHDDVCTLALGFIVRPGSGTPTDW